MIASFIMASLDGYFEGEKPWDLDWHRTDEEFNDFAAEQLDQFDTLVFGRATYEGMAQYWPSEEAIKSDPEVAARMNDANKIVVSRTLTSPVPAWNNTRLVKDSRELRSDEKILVLGSAVLTTSLLEDGLLDELRIMVNPVLLGSGRSLATSAKGQIPLRLLARREFRNGNVLLTYAPDR
ncbi:MAG TPA: dihydrofolate reductase family protein [Candidatus Dormibacteraeota bacterium]